MSPFSSDNAAFLEATQREAPPGLALALQLLACLRQDLRCPPLPQAQLAAVNFSLDSADPDGLFICGKHSLKTTPTMGFFIERSSIPPVYISRKYILRLVQKVSHDRRPSPAD